MIGKLLSAQPGVRFCISIIPDNTISALDFTRRFRLSLRESGIDFLQ
jgi:hypothetical protein